MDELDALKNLGEQLTPPPEDAAEVARARRKLDRLIEIAERDVEPPAPPRHDLPGRGLPGWPDDGLDLPGPGGIGR